MCICQTDKLQKCKTRALNDYTLQLSYSVNTFLTNRTRVFLPPVCL